MVIANHPQDVRILRFTKSINEAGYCKLSTDTPHTSVAFHLAFVAFQDIRRKRYTGCEMHHQRVFLLFQRRSRRNVSYEAEEERAWKRTRPVR